MATKKSNKSLWVMLALIAAIIAVILLLPSCGNRNAKKDAETDAESTTLVKPETRLRTSRSRWSTAAP